MYILNREQVVAKFLEAAATKESSNMSTEVTKKDPLPFDFLIKLMVLGNSGVGKTSFIYQYVDGKKCDKYITTVGVDFREKTVEIPEQNRKVSLQIWDTAGQERYRSLNRAFFRDAMGFILIYDVTDEKSFLDVTHWIVELQTHTYTCTPKVLLCGNKIDLQSERKVPASAAKKLADE